jgi:hypothetical protein
MRALRPDELLAVEPGNIPLETGRHHQFEAFRVPHGEGREWYAPEPELLDHIARMRMIYEAPLLPTRQSPRPRRSSPFPETLDIPEGSTSPEDVRVFLAMSDAARAELPSEHIIALVKDLRDRRKHVLGTHSAELRRRGWTWPRIGKAVGVDQSTAYGWAQPYLKPGE